jgi:hypothetical protein
VLQVSGPDTLPVADRWVVMHQVTSAGGGAIDSVRTDRFGAYFLRAAERDTNALYLSSVSHLGITYFAPPVRAIEFTSDTAETLFVYDTSSTAPTVDLTQRFVVIRAAGPDGARSVLELLTLANEGTLTRVAPDSTAPVWREVLPTGAVRFEIGESDVSPEAVFRSGDTVGLIAPMPPGEKQLVFGYRLPGSDAQLSVPVHQAVGRLEVLVEDTLAVMTTNTLRRSGDEVMQSIRFARYEGANVPAGAAVTFQFPEAPLALQQFWWVLVVGAALAFAVTVVVWWKRTPSRTIVDSPTVLAARIAALDESFEARAAAASDAERRVYERTRSELKARLSAALARRPSSG